MRKIVIDPRVIKHLGRDLITSPEVAIIELIKNSIDAKASHINLRLYNSMPSNGLIPDCVSDSVPNKYLASPILVVEDDGCGMTDATIDGGFLKIATDIKSNEESTLGEKGIGRLAAQRLGTALLVETSSDKENHTSYELHSLSKTGIVPDASEHFDFLKDYFVQSSGVRVYNQHVIPIKNSYGNISGKLDQIGSLYSFLETTFIKKGTYDEFIHECIESVISNIRKNLLSTVKKERVQIVCSTKDLTWFVPKGVLLHVFYNLINNSLYWIDVRRKRAQSDSTYAYPGTDTIAIEEYGVDGIVVYDTGTGVSKSMEDILFEPLQSGKPLSEGRGMGLYIVRKLLNSFGGEIELLDERNEYGNRYKFLLVSNTSEEL